MTEYRAGPDGYEVLIDERVLKGVKAQWVPVPARVILRTTNPTGRAVVCARATSPEITILCFVTPNET